MRPSTHDYLRLGDCRRLTKLTVRVECHHSRPRLGPLIQTLSFSSIPTTLNTLAIHLSFTSNLVKLGDWAAIDVILTTKYSSVSHMDINLLPRSSSQGPVTTGYITSAHSLLATDLLPSLVSSASETRQIRFDITASQPR